MYRVSTYCLGPGAQMVDPSYETTDLGELSAEEFTELLDTFCEVDPVQNEEHDPHVIAWGRTAKLIIRTSSNRLQVYDGRDPNAPGEELTVAEIMDRLAEKPSAASGGGKEQPAPTAPHRGIAFAMLVVGLALNGYILFSVFYVESVNKKVDVKLISDADEVKTREESLAGVYATGNRTGDRVIEVESSGDIRFYEIGAKGAINENKDAYRMGRHDGVLCLLTKESGVVDLSGDTLIYYRDVYTRRRPSP
jgi:hypothetical protein